MIRYVIYDKKKKKTFEEQFYKVGQVEINNYYF